MAVTIRFFIWRSSFFRSFSAARVIVILYIDLAVGSHFIYELKEITFRLVLGCFVYFAQVQILEQFFVFLDRENHRGLMTVCIDDVLDVCHEKILAYAA